MSATIFRVKMVEPGGHHAFLVPLSGTTASETRGRDVYLPRKNTRFGVIPPPGSLMLCTTVPGQRNPEATEVRQGPVYARSTVSTVISPGVLVLVESIFCRAGLHTSKCEPGTALPPVGATLVCKLQESTFAGRAGKIEASPLFDGLPVECVLVQLLAGQGNRVTLQSPSVEYGNLPFDLEGPLPPGAPAPVIGQPLGTFYLKRQPDGSIVATATPPRQFDGWLIAHCTVTAAASRDTGVVTATGPASVLPLLGVAARIALHRHDTGLGVVPPVGTAVRCWVRQVEPMAWQAFVCPPEITQWPAGNALPQTCARMEDAVYTYLSTLHPNGSAGIAPEFRLPMALQQTLSLLYIAPAVQLAAPLGKPAFLWVLCDADIVRLADRWNMGMDIYPLSGGYAHWCQLVRFQSQCCFDRFRAQLSFYWLSRKQNQQAKMLVPSVACQQPCRRVSAGIPAHQLPVIAIDCLTARSKDDAIQIFVDPADATATAVVARFLIATPFSQDDVDRGRASLGQGNPAAFFGNAAWELNPAMPACLREARTNLMDAGKVKMFANKDAFGLSSTTPVTAAVYEQRFTVDVASFPDAAGVLTPEEVFIPTSPMTVQLQPHVLIDAALTFEQVTAFENGDLDLPQPVEDQLRLLRRLVNFFDRQSERAKQAKEQAAVAAAAAASAADADGGMMPSCSSLDDPFLNSHLSTLDLDDEPEEAAAAPKPEKPCALRFGVNPEGFDLASAKYCGGAKFYRTSVDGIPTSADPKRVSFLRYNHLFRDEQNATLFATCGFSVKAERDLTPEQQALLDTKLLQLGLPPVPATTPRFQLCEAYTKALNFDGRYSCLMEMLGTAAVETRVPVMYADTQFLPHADLPQLQSQGASAAPYWAANAAAAPPAGVACTVEIPHGSVPGEELTCGFLVSSKPLREYNHLLAQYMLLLVGRGRCRASDAPPAPALTPMAPALQNALALHCVAALHELNHKARAKATQALSHTLTYLADDALPYARVVLVEAKVVAADPATGRVTLVSDAIRRLALPPAASKMLKLVVAGVPPTDPVMAPPGTFGGARKLLLKCKARGGVADVEIALLPLGASLAQVVDPADWGLLLTPWQGQRAVDLIQQDEALRNVPLPSPPFTLYRGQGIDVNAVL